MIIAITGTPGTGKTSVAERLKKNDFKVIDFNKLACENNWLIVKDENRDSNIVDIKKFDNFIKENYKSEDIIFIEGHLSHLLRNIDKIILLRCHPDKLRNNLSNKKWNQVKIKENIEAEILDIILCESIDIHPKNNIFEIDVTKKSVNKVTSNILEIIENKFKIMKKYKIGKIDWSEEILNEF